MADAIALLKADHKKVKALFKEAAELGDRAYAARAKLFRRIAAELTVHSKVEETVFYPALKKKSKPGTEERDEVLEAYEEHAAAKTLIHTLEQTDPKDETFKAKVQVLNDMVDHHVKVEETEMFKQARILLNQAELEELGEEMTAMKEAEPALA